LYFYRARYYDPQLMRFISEDPIGLAGGTNSYGYVDGMPIGKRDPNGLWSITFGGYYGIGGEITFGNDGGNGFMTGRFGFGAGAGATYDPLGGLPGPAPDNRGRGGLVLSCSVKGDLTGGPFQAGGELGAARNYSNGDSSLYGGLNGNARLDSFRGIGATGSAGGQITIYTRKQ
jgi:hypothetical protein